MGVENEEELWGGYADPPCLVETLTSAARRLPATVAVVDESGSITYAQLSVWAARIADDLRHHGARPGDRIGIACPRGAEAVASMVATALAGLTFVPLDLEYPRQRLEHMLNDSGARLLLTDGSPAAADLSAAAAAVPVGSPPEAAGGPGSAPAVACDPDLAIYVIYTSGSTGWPKGVVLQHSSLDNVAHWQTRCSPAADLRTAQFAPLNFDVSFQEVFGTLCGGGTLVVVPERLRRDPARLVDWLAEHRIERLFLPYVALQMVAVAATYGAPVERLALTEVNVAGEQLVITDDIRALFTRLPGCRLVNHYGQSESAMVSYHVLGPEPARWPALPPIGVPLPGCELLLDHADRAGDGVGELLVAGRPVSLGYLNQPALNERRFIDLDPPTRHGHTRAFRTGDLVRLVDGRVQFVTRVDDDVKLRGIRVNLAEIEAQLVSQPGIAAAAVVVSGGKGGPRTLRAAVVLRDGTAPLDETEVLDRLRLTLPDVSVPLSCVAVPSLPRTPSGKADRDAVTRLIEEALTV